jgi:hypothetical protein
MKKDILKIAGVKSEAEFYKKFPKESDFMAKHGGAFKKAKMGAAMVKKQLTQLTDFSNPPQAQVGWHSEWEQDPYLEITDADAAYLAEMDARNVAESPMRTPSINVPKSVTEAKKPVGNNYSVVDFLNTKGKKSDFATRKALAESYGIKGYTGTAEQNLRLLSNLKGKTPATQKAAPQKQSTTSAPQKKETPAQAKAAKTAEASKLSRAEQYIANDPYFFAEESDPSWVKAIDAPFAGLRNLGAKVVLDQDPMALLKLLGMGAMSNSIIGQTKTMPYNPYQIPEVVGAARAAGKALPYATRALPGFAMGGYVPRAEVGDYIGGGQSSYTPVNYTDLYDQADYTVTGSNRKMRMEDQNLAAQQEMAANSGKKGGMLGMLGQLAPQLDALSADSVNISGPSASQFAASDAAMNADFAAGLRYGGYIPRAQNGFMQGLTNFGKKATDFSNKAGKSIGQGYDKVDKSLGKVGGITGAIPIVGDLVEGFQQLKEEKRIQKGAQQFNELSGLTKQVAGLAPDIQQRRYTRAEDQAFGTQEMGQAYGSAANNPFLQMEYGGSIGGNPTEIQNMYNPGDIYSNLGYEPLSDSEIVKQYRRGGLVPRAQFGDAGNALGSLIGGGKGRPTAGGKIGGTIGSTVGKFIPVPGASQALEFVGSTVGSIFGGKSAAKTERLQNEGQQNVENAAFMSGAKGLQSQNSSFMKSGGSVVDYMNSKKMGSSFEDRKKLYEKAYKGDTFSGTSEQNKKLLNYLTSDSKPTSSKKQDFGPRARPAATQFGSYDPTVFPENRNLESGVVVDKNTNIAHILQGNKIVKSFPVLTGQARDANVNERGVQYLENHPESRATPTGSYFMNPSKDIYGEPGFMLNPISAYGDPRPRAKSVAEHVTYNPSERDRYYDLPSEQRNKSYGCVNCKKPDINQLTSMFPQGDTTMVIDTRKLADKNLLSKMSKREHGGWVSHDWQPQVIAKFGDYDLKDLLKEDPTMDTLRSGGHLKDYSYTPPSMEALETMAMGGQLKTTWGGYAEPISQNPYLPGSGETVMFRGKSHEESDGNGHTGIGVKYGSGGHDDYTDYAEFGTEQADADVEVERGEPATELMDRATGETSMIVYGDMKIPSYGVSELKDPKAKGKKFKNYANDLSKLERKQTSILDKAIDKLDNLNPTTAFEKLEFDSLSKVIDGANMQLKGLAAQKELLAGIQNAILDTSKEFGVKSAELAKGKIKEDKDSDMAKFGGKFTQAQVGVRQPLTPILPMSTYYRIDPKTDFRLTTSPEVQERIQQKPIENKKVTKGKSPAKQVEKPGRTKLEPFVSIDTPRRGVTDVDISPKITAKVPDYARDMKAPKSEEQAKKDKFGIDDALRQLQPYLIPSNQEPFDASQITPEMYALAMNQLEPVQAQTFQPLLETPYSVSLQDQLNANQADFNALQRQMGYNPAAAATLAAQKYAANSAILGQQFRANQEMQMGTYNRNRGILNDATLKNLSILDNQYQRQSQAKSATKAQAQAALSSISDKMAKHKLENRTLGVYENMYNYRFGPKGRAINVNAPYEFGNLNVASLTADELELAKKYKELEKKKGTKKDSTGKNGSIVKAIKNL